MTSSSAHLSRDRLRTSILCTQKIQRFCNSIQLFGRSLEIVRRVLSFSPQMEALVLLLYRSDAHGDGDSRQYPTDSPPIGKLLLFSVFYGLGPTVFPHTGRTLSRMSSDPPPLSMPMSAGFKPVECRRRQTTQTTFGDRRRPLVYDVANDTSKKNMLSALIA